MAHMGTGEIGLQGYMPEVERAPRSPDSGAPVSQQVPSREVLLCPQGCAESQQCCSVCPSASWLHLGNCSAGDCSAALGCCRAGRKRRWEEIGDT